MRLSRILMLMGALALPAVPAAAQGKAIGKPAGVGKPATTTVKGASGTVTKGKSADAKAGTLVKGNSADRAKGPKTTATDADTDTAVTTESKGRGQLTLAERIEMNPTLKARADAVLEGTGLTLLQATEGFRNQGQFVAALNAAEHNPTISFVDLRTKMTGPDQLSLGAAMEQLKAEASTTTTPATTTTP